VARIDGEIEATLSLRRSVKSEIDDLPPRQVRLRRAIDHIRAEPNAATAVEIQVRVQIIRLFARTKDSLELGHPTRLVLLSEPVEPAPRLDARLARDDAKLGHVDK